MKLFDVIDVQPGNRFETIELHNISLVGSPNFSPFSIEEDMNQRTNTNFTNGDRNGNRTIPGTKSIVGDPGDTPGSTKVIITGSYFEKFDVLLEVAGLKLIIVCLI